MIETHEYGKEPSMMEQRDAYEIQNAKLRSELEAERGKVAKLKKRIGVLELELKLLKEP